MTDETKEPEANTVSGGQNERLVMQLRIAIKEGFMTCNSVPGGPYSVSIEFHDLNKAHVLHRLLSSLPAA